MKDSTRAGTRRRKGLMMTAKMKRLFGDMPMTWPVVLIFGLVAGVYTGLMNSIPALANTSFHDIAETHEWWVIFAFVIAANSKKGWQCALKTFVFFLVSQPLCFLTEVLLGAVSADMAMYYYFTNWGPATLFTLPGGFIAFFITRQNPLGWIVLGMGCALQAILGCHHFGVMLKNPPFHLLTVLVCFASIFFMTWQIQRDKKGRIATIAICALVVAAVLGYVFANGLSI